MPPEPDPPRATEHTPVWKLVLGAAVIVILAGGWYLLAWRTGDSPGDALAQALGMAFALLIVVSVIGAVLGRRHDDQG